MISFIIPCYNAQETIQRTVNSVLSQTIKDYEIILINDGSTDNTLHILNDLALNNACIKVVDKQNGGVSSARNVGIKHATGEYINFLDADDYIEPTTIQNLIPLMGTDMVLYGWRYEKQVGLFKNFKPYVSRQPISDYLLLNLRIHMCSFLIKKELLLSNNIIFSEKTYYAEDIEFITKCLFYAKNINYYHDVLFTYNYCQTSVTRVVEYNSKRQTSVFAHERIYRLLENTKFADAALIQLKYTIIAHFHKYHRSQCNDKNLLTILFRYKDNYLVRHTPLLFNKVAMYVYIFSILFRMGLYNNIITKAK